RRVLQNVDQDVENKQHVITKHADIINNILARRISVEMAAHGFDLDGNVARAAPPRTLESHVFEQMNDAIDLPRLVARADADPDAERHRLDTEHNVGSDSQPVR